MATPSSSTSSSAAPSPNNRPPSSSSSSKAPPSRPYPDSARSTVFPPPSPPISSLAGGHTNTGAASSASTTGYYDSKRGLRSPSVTGTAPSPGAVAGITAASPRSTFLSSFAGNSTSRSRSSSAASRSGGATGAAGGGSSFPFPPLPSPYSGIGIGSSSSAQSPPSYYGTGSTAAGGERAGTGGYFGTSSARSPASYTLASSERSTAEGTPPPPPHHTGGKDAAESTPLSLPLPRIGNSASANSSTNSFRSPGQTTGTAGSPSASATAAATLSPASAWKSSSSAARLPSYPGAGGTGGMSSSTTTTTTTTLNTTTSSAYDPSYAPTNKYSQNGSSSSTSIAPSYSMNNSDLSTQGSAAPKAVAGLKRPRSPSSSSPHGAPSPSSANVSRSPSASAGAGGVKKQATQHSPSGGSSGSPTGAAGKGPTAADADASAASAAAAAAAAAKRIKTPRACDSCRRKKIRCDVIDSLGVCMHCKTYHLECTFYLPISETRFKKKRDRELEEAQAAALAAATAAAHQRQSHHHQHQHQHQHQQQQQQHYAPMAYPAAAAAAAAAAAMTYPPPHHQHHQMQHPHAAAAALAQAQAQAQAHVSRMLPPLKSASLAQEWPPAASSAATRGTLPPILPSPLSSSSGLQRGPSGTTTTGPAALAAKLAASRSPSSSAHGGTPGGASGKGSTSSPAGGQGAKSSSDAREGSQPPDSSVLGPTSIAYLVHSTAFVPSAALEDHDIKHHQTFEVGASGDGIIKFHKLPRSSSNDNGVKDGNGTSERGGAGGGRASVSSSSDEELPPPELPEVVRARLAGDVAEKLVNSYFEKLAPLFPIVTKSEFLHLSPPPPLLLYAVCSVAALARDVPREVLSATRSTLGMLLRDSDILSNSSSVAIRALLVMSLHQDVHGSSAVQSGARSWNRLGCAIRMAQDLGLHRDASGRDDVDEDAFFLEQKRRIWGSCVTADRWASIFSGRPLAIDLTDCDVRLPSPFEVLRFESDPPSRPGDAQPFIFNTEMLKLSILFGRVMKTIYSPTGLMKATDEEITGLLGDIDIWRDSLPDKLQFKGKESNPEAGILHIAHACLQVLFFRVFLRISYVCPTHLKFSMTIERMTQMLGWAKESIDWILDHEFYFDTLGLISYSLVSCAILLYHAQIRRGDKVALEKLQALRAFFKLAAEKQEGADDSMRAKSGAVISLLCDAAEGAFPSERYSGALNPTAGVSNRKTAEAVSGLKFKPDPSRPGGGVYVAETSQVVVHDLPRGTVILKEADEARSMPVFTQSPKSGAWQIVSGNRDSMAMPSIDPDAAPGAKLVTMFPLATGLANFASLQDGDTQPQAQHIAQQQQQQQQAAQQQAQQQLDQMGAFVPRSDSISAGMAFANVNPLLNDAGWNTAANFVLESSAELAPNLQGSGVDPLLLDGLPQHLDFDAWSSWFARLQPSDVRDSDLTSTSLAA